MEKIMGFIPCPPKVAVLLVTIFIAIFIVRIVLRAFGIDYEGWAVGAVQSGFGLKKTV